MYQAVTYFWFNFSLDMISAFCVILCELHSFMVRTVREQDLTLGLSVYSMMPQAVTELQADSLINTFID